MVQKLADAGLSHVTLQSVYEKLNITGLNGVLALAPSAKSTCHHISNSAREFSPEFISNCRNVRALLVRVLLVQSSPVLEIPYAVKCDKKGGGELICQSNVTNSSCSTRFTREKTAKMAGQNCFGVSEVYTWLSSISHGLNLERLAPEFERRPFQSMHSRKNIGQNDLEVIINSLDKLLLAERRILEKELEEIKKPSLQPKELFPSSYNGPLQVVSPINSPVLVSTTSSGPASSSSNVPVSGTMYQQSAVKESNDQSTTYLGKKSGELTQNLSIIQTQIKIATDQLEIVRNQYEEASSKANGRRAEKLCTRCHQPGHHRARCSNPTCMDMNNCGASEKHPESKNEITELRKLIKDLQKKEPKASEELQSFTLAKERSVNSFFAVIRPD
ncbi:hypothetical protein AWC38_SpisGene11450 [Stylophora pistillata]|uniref:CCHC-type domain-containing protein n=1 Tax=Stylophora pistillata TaxID=50429 RepID=A0A2B4S691_STYPI|nr:hypothetical protein AWC38_SpisGene11450 [Stylophora pistillata]